MEMKYPVIITSRLCAGLRVADAELSIKAEGRTDDNRIRWRYWVDIPGKRTCTGDDLASGVGRQVDGEAHQEALGSLLSFLGACGEAYHWAEQRQRKLSDTENGTMFPRYVARWAAYNRDELSIMACELEETPNAIT